MWDWLRCMRLGKFVERLVEQGYDSLDEFDGLGDAAAERLAEAVGMVAPQQAKLRVELRRVSFGRHLTGGASAGGVSGGIGGGLGGQSLPPLG